MVLLIILLSIAVIITFLCLCHISLSVCYIDEKLGYDLKYFAFTLFSSKKNKKSTKEHTKNDGKDNARKNKNAKLNNKLYSENPKNKINTLPEESEFKSETKSRLKSKIDEYTTDKDSVYKNISLIKELLQSKKKPAKWILNGILIDDINVDFTVSDEDAYECAMKYGKISILLYNVLGFISSYFKMKKKSISVLCKFNEKKSVYNLSFKIKLRFGTAIIAVFGILITFFVNTIKSHKLKEVKSKEAIHA